MSENNTGSSGGIGVVGLLGIVFIVLKLTDVIDWGWAWVLLPLWGGLAIGLSIFLVIIIITVLASKSYLTYNKLGALIVYD